MTVVLPSVPDTLPEGMALRVSDGDEVAVRALETEELISDWVPIRRNTVTVDIWPDVPGQQCHPVVRLAGTTAEYLLMDVGDWLYLQGGDSLILSFP